VIVVDTNVVSEALRAAPDRKVIAWLDAQPIETLFLPAISYAELMLSVRQLPPGKRRAGIAESLDRVLSELFGDRTLSFDLAAAKAYAHIVTDAREQGLALSIADAQIASIARSRNFRIATRDSAFAHAGVAVINPWDFLPGE